MEEQDTQTTTHAERLMTLSVNLDHRPHMQAACDSGSRALVLVREMIHILTGPTFVRDDVSAWQTKANALLQRAE